MIDFERLTSAIKWARWDQEQKQNDPNHIRQWFQSTWAMPHPCGTAGCIAGHVVQDAGYTVKFDGEVYNENGYYIGRAPSMAQDMLGISLSERADLFASENTIEDLERILKEIAERHGYELP